MRFKEHRTKCSVLEVNQAQGFGANIDVIVGDGTLQKSDEIVACDMDERIVTGRLVSVTNRQRRRGTSKVLAQAACSCTPRR